MIDDLKRTRNTVRQQANDQSAYVAAAGSAMAIKRSALGRCPCHVPNASHMALGLPRIDRRLMKHWITNVIVAAAVLTAGPAHAQKLGSGPGFIEVTSTAGGSVFFGQDTRYGHRVYGAVTVDFLR